MNSLNKTNNKLYIFLMLILFTSTFTLNFCNKISSCALVFTIIAFTSNVLSEFYSRKIAVLGIFLSSIISFCLLWNFDYTLNRAVINGVVLMSLVSVFISAYIGTGILKTNTNLNFHKRNLISFISYAFVDGIVMSGFFMNKFSSHKILTIFSKEIFFKLAYFSIAYIAIFITSNIYQHMNNKANPLIS
ncbi:MAG: VUT family protein [Rickettsiales bacterium]|nr:MAG: VUT family protein [Rickettsiales bacterium]